VAGAEPRGGQAVFRRLPGCPDAGAAIRRPGGAPSRAEKQIGYYPNHPTAAGRGLFDEGLHVYHWHGDGFELPAGGTLLATGSTFPNEAFSMGANVYGVQFHPEIDGAIMRRWIAAGIEDGDMKHNGAQSGAEQEALHQIHEPGMQAWLDRFLAHWLDAPDREAGE
jgi:GMP synthase (glutamine-hydrolysing)